MSFSSIQWRVMEIVSVPDGDSVRLRKTRRVPFEVSNEMEGFVTLQSKTKGQLGRLVTVDTPEKGDPLWREAGDQLEDWLREREDYLMVTTFEAAGWGRDLMDIYDERNGDSASAYMLSLGYPLYEK